ncbi:serine/threonine protein kinase [Cryobacterium melibiosiphilum]|uniref:non-specific serine/threonine protein kinase n=1 Tax=Cryobacterium melibiosiphilum TaxID=995039 RepID=A0A3A5MNN3_9MICO|nr:serine/threonine-protein kinase [Cryobacterium melibiosiphilum]RJT90681.1 serine/threonine protein kinase [Cryobacterium melibiosiphilum]
MNSTRAIGAVLADRFRLDRLIGTGGMASVYEATDAALGRTVAVKLFRNDSLDGAGPERQSGEIALLASLNHFALVTLYDAGTTEINGAPRTFIVMEYVDGSDLRTRIQAGPPLEPADVARMGADLAEALHYVHGRGIIHRDIKPANVLLGASGFPGRSMHAKLADFGIARLLDETRLTATGTLLGTASYLSPEQALGGSLGSPTDLYSLGLVLLECLTGERAYPGTAVESAMARLQRQPSIPASLGSGWSQLLTAMTSRDPADRPTAADAAVTLRALATTGLATDVPAPVDPSAAATELLATIDATSGVESTAAMPAPTRLLPAADDAPAPTLLLPVTPFTPAPPTAATVVAPVVAAAVAAPAAASAAPTAVPNAGGGVLRSPSSQPRAMPKRAVITGSIVIAVVMLGALIALFIATQTVQPVSPPPNYPAVDGQLGTSLQQLQESVNP